MSMTDPVADMLTRIRNASRASHKAVSIPGSRLKEAIAKILKEEGYIVDFSVSGEKASRAIKVKLKYAEEGQKVITTIKRISKPGLRIYVGKDEIPSVLNGLGVNILSTPKGVITDKTARELGVGGELLCSVF